MSTKPGADVPVTVELASALAASHERRSLAPAGRPGVDDSAGQMSLVPPFEDRGEIGRGGMGVVRRAWDARLRRRVAVKVVRPSLADDPSVVARFLTEARITAQLDHPNIVPVHLLGDGPDGSPSLAMKLVEGRTFTEYLRELPPPPWPAAVLDDVLGAYLKVCDAVAFAHSRGVVHLDLKPDNIMVGPFGQVYLMDWGIARSLRRQGTEEESAPSREASACDEGPLGTPSYMAPEQALQDRAAIDERTDVYLLGGILYEVLTGRAPHAGTSMLAAFSHAIGGQITQPEAAAPERQPPPALARVAMKAMRHDRRDRYPSVLDLRRDVAHFLRGEERAPTRSYAPGDRVIVEGQEGAAAYVIVSGRCVAYKEDGGVRKDLREMGPGDVFGETAVFTARPYSATVEAREPLTVKVVTRESLSESLGLQTWMGAFVRELAKRFREVDERLHALERLGRPPKG